jgi:hypothetical protein
VKALVPFVAASVFRTGIGGEVFSYLPGITGCYGCLQIFSSMHGADLSDAQLGLTPEEEEKMYGLGERDFRASGLSVDIQMIALIQVRMALSLLLRGLENSLPRLEANWIIFGNRPSPGIFERHFQVKPMLLRPQTLCNCTTKNDVATVPGLGKEPTC